MRTIDPGLQAHLAGQVTTVCHCWRVIRRDGAVFGFTEHDHDLAFGGTQFLAASGFSASDGEAESGLPAATSDVTGGFASNVISEADLEDGLYDGARVEVYLVNWAVPAQNVLLRVQEIGQVTRQTGQFQAELRSFAARLSEPQGRIYNRRCDAVLGDARCAIDLGLAQYRAEGVIAAVIDATRLTIGGPSGFADGFFSRGTLTFVDGSNAGATVDIDSHSAADDGALIGLWLPLKKPAAIGDRVVLHAGCDKLFSTCRQKFANGDNFQGFPHMPGADFAYSYVDGTSLHDGSALFP